MGPRDRLLSPLLAQLRRSPAQDAVTGALAAVFGAEALDGSAFGEDLLRRVPLERLQAVVDGLRDRHGAVRGVRRRGDLHQVQFAHGTELVWARVSADGRLTTLVTGPGALTARTASALPLQSRTDLPTTDLPAPVSAPLPSGDPAPDNDTPQQPASGEGPGGADVGSRDSGGWNLPRRGAAPGVSTAPGGSPPREAAAPQGLADGAAPALGPGTPPAPVPARGGAVSALGGGSFPVPVLPGGGAALGGGLVRVSLGYLAAAVATAVVPYLTATATGWLLLIATAPALAWFALRTGPTHALPPWFRALPLAAVALAALAGLRALPAFGPGLPWTMPGIPELTLFAAGLGLAGWTWRRTRPIQPSPSAHPLTLASPLRGGCFTFTEAGGPAVNRYAQDSLAPGASRHRRYAMDLVQLGDGPQWRGRRALGLAPAGNERYAVFGHPVLSPCDGVVVAAVDGLPDHAPFAPAGDHPEGNHVAIDTGRALVVLSWLRQDSIRVRRGQHLTVGAPVAAVGSSGDGSEPALHLRAETRTSQPTPGTGTGLPFRIGGLRGFPLRGRRLRVPD